MRYFKMTLILAALLAVVPGAQAQTRGQIERIARKINEVDDLGRLDRLGLIRGSVKIVIQHTAWEGPEFEVRRFRSFRAAERWLDSRSRDGFPRRMSLPLAGCARGVCTFDTNGGILHNQLYRKKILYGFRNKRLYIKAVYFLDGD